MVLDRADSALGRVPMVRLVLSALAALAVVAVLGSIPGWVPFPTLPLLASLAVAVAVTWAGAQVMALLARTPAHPDSALVTGLILFFIVYPSGRVEDLLLLAAAALIADASKYLIRIGGRHVLNPAAVGAFVVGLTGLIGSAWWVATPALLPFVVLAVLLIAVRVRLVGPVVLLVVLGAVLEVLGAAVNGFDAAQAGAAALVSTPLLFLAGVMFTEPITLPPRRWQRYAEAAIVAVVFAIPYVAPFRLLTFGPTPEFALLLGNLFALLIARPVAAGLRFAGRRDLTPTSTEFAFTPDRPIRHRAGQYLELQLPHRGADRRGIRRSLTIVSAPDEADGTVRVAVRTRQPGSTFKAALADLPVDGRARAVSVAGGFTLPRDRRTPVVLVASGIGITPFVSQLRQDAAEVAAGAEPRDVLLVDRVPSADEIPYLDELVETGVRVLLVCPDPAGLPPLPDHWHVAERFDADALAAVLPDPATRSAYVSGSPGFVALARRTLRQIGVRRIRTDAFAGY